MIELLIAVAIVAILASIAYPSYQDSVQKTRRATAQADLVKLASFMERTFTESNTYVLATGVSLPDYGTEQYTLGFAASQPTASTFVIQAVPSSGQSSDLCGTMTISHTGATTPTTNNCW